MKRIRAACLCQTLHFFQREDADRDHAAKAVQEEVNNYKHHLERNCIPYKITSETVQPDGSILLKIIKQYNNSPVGDYLEQ